MKRIGIYAGTFNPVHSGHVTFAMQAIQAAQLDAVYFLPERRSRSKQGVEHFGHRVAMLKAALRPHPECHVLELEDVSFSVKTTMPRLQRKFTGSQLVFLFGSDVVPTLPAWPQAEQLLQTTELVIGVRHGDKVADIKRQIEHWPIQPKALSIFTSFAPQVSSSQVRQALHMRTDTKGLLKSVQRYSDHNWLYVSVA